LLNPPPPKARASSLPKGLPHPRSVHLTLTGSQGGMSGAKTAPNGICRSQLRRQIHPQIW